MSCDVVEVFEYEREEATGAECGLATVDGREIRFIMVDGELSTDTLESLEDLGVLYLQDHLVEAVAELGGGV